jgi:hypothetical protein
VSGARRDPGAGVIVDREHNSVSPPSPDHTEEPKSQNVEWMVLETVVELPWAADSSPRVVETANRVAINRQQGRPLYAYYDNVAPQITLI